MSIFIYIILCLIWGSTWIAIKLGLSDAPPLYSSGIRFLVSVSILYLFVAFRKVSFPKSFKHFVRLGYPGLYMYGACYALVYFAELYINSALTAVLFASFPLFVALFSIWILPGEKLSTPGWLGLLLGFLGIVVISFDSLQTSSDIFKGTLLALGSSLTAAYGMVLHKQKFSKENIFTATSVQMTLGGVPLVFAAIIFEKWSDLNFSAVSIGSILYLSVFGTVIAFLGYYWLLKRITAVQVSLIAFITPIVAIFIGVLFFSESLTVLILIGTLMILSGIMLVNRN